MAAICGIDWASEWHDVRIGDEPRRAAAAERRFAHDERGFERADRRSCSSIGVARVAIERPDGLLVGRLLAAGIVVLAIHPNQVERRARSLPGRGGKSDRFDAFVLCELARTDPHRFPALAPSGDETLALKALVRTREDLVDAPCRAGQPAARSARAVLAGRRSDLRRRRQPDRACLPRALPEPRRRSWPRREAPRRLPGRHAYCGRRTARRAARAAAQRTAALPANSRAEARRAAVLGLVAALSPIVEQISQLTSQIARRRPLPPRRSDLPLVLPRPEERHHRRRPARRDRRQPRPLPDRRRARRRRRPSPCRDPVRQAPHATLPLGLRQAPAQTLRASWPTAPATGIPGPTTSTSAPALAAATTLTRSASSAVPGPACSGAAGRTTRPTTPPDTKLSTLPLAARGLTQGVSADSGTRV